MEKRKKERAAFIRVENSHYSDLRPLFVGPFIDNTEAQEFVKNKGVVEDSQILKYTFVGKTAAKREGMKFSLYEMPKIEDWLSIFESHGEDPYKTNRGRPKKLDGEQSAEILFPEKVLDGRSEKPDSKEIIIVATNMNLLLWLGSRGFRCSQVLSSVDNEEQLRNKWVIAGSLSPWFVRTAKKWGIVYVPGVKWSEVSKFSPEDFDRYHARIDWYEPPRLEFSE